MPDRAQVTGNTPQKDAGTIACVLTGAAPCRAGHEQTRMEDGTYAFKGSMFWKLTEDSVLPGYPKNISKFWKGLPGKIDASFTWANGKSFFFKDKKYWRFTNGKMDPSYPRLIRKGFDGIPDHVDAAFVWSGNEKIYFFKGSQYWRFDPDKRPPVSEGYPK